jgi:hypothetical protein
MNKEDKIHQFKAYLISGFIIALVYHYILGFYFLKGYPRNTFLFDPKDHFMDFINLYINKSSLYFPFCNLIINIFSKITPIEISIILFILFSLIFLLTFFFLQLKTVKLIDTINSTMVFSFCTFPFLFVFDRLNLEIIVYAFCVIFLYYYKKNQNIIAIITLSFAISMKLFPIMFLLLYFVDSRYKLILITLISSILITLISNYVLGNTIEEMVQFTIKNGILYNKNYVIEDAGLDFGHSLMGLFKYLLKVFHRQNLIYLVLNYYIFIILPIILYSIYFLKFYSITLWEKVTIITILFCLLPSVSADYKLIHFFTPIFLFINSNTDYLNNKKNILFKINANEIYIFLFSFLLIPKNYRVFTSFVYDGVYIDPIILIIIFILIVKFNRSKKQLLS